MQLISDKFYVFLNYLWKIEMIDKIESIFDK